MTPSDVHQVVSQAIWAILIASGPVLVAALLAGLAIALFQALTSVQDMTLVFVPKIAAIMVVIGLSLPFIYTTLANFSDEIFNLIMYDGF